MMYCAKHPDTTTNLSCGRCENAICTRCMVHAPVGVRCRDCAQVRRLPTFDVSKVYLARGIGAGLVLGILLGSATAALLSYVFLGLMFIIVAIVGVGYLVGEGISAAVNRKRGRSLKFVAAGATLLAYSIISVFNPVATFSLYGLLAGGLALYAATSRF